MLLLTFPCLLWAADSVSYRVKVTDPNGQPIPGAVVERYRAPNWMMVPAQRPMAESRTTTGNDGMAVFTLSNRTELTFVVSKQGLSIGWSTLWPGMSESDEPIEITLTKPIEVSGKVQDAGGKPVVDAEVWVSYASRPANRAMAMGFETLSSWFGRRALGARTGADGTFRITGLPADASLELTAAKPGLAPDQTDPGYINPSSMSYQAGQSNVVLTMRTAGAVEGVVVQEGSGTPAANAFILPSWAWYGNHQQVAGPTGADGRFAIRDLSPGELTLRAIVGTNQFADWICEDVHVAVEAGATNRNAQIAASRGAVLEVTLRDGAEGKPLSDANVNVSREGMGSMAKTGDNGIARLRLGPNEYYVHATKEGYGSENAQVTLEANQTNRLDFSLKPLARLLGMVADAEGKPAPNVMVNLFPMHGVQKKTDAQGRFSLSPDPNQSYGRMEQARMLIARDPQRNLAAVLELDDEATNANLRLQPGLVLAGRVTDPGGKALATAEIQVVFWTERTGTSLDRPIKVDAQGQFELKGLPQGRRYGLNVSAKGFGREDRNLTVEDTGKGRVELEPFQLPVADQRIAGVVLDSDDKPVAGAWVNTYGNKQPTIQRRTDPKGRFAFDQVCAGPIRLSANDQHGGFGSAAAEAGDTNVTIQLGRNAGAGGNTAKLIKISGKVVDDEGKPAPRAIVWLFPFHEAERKTDNEGNFRITANPNQWGGQQDFGRTLIARDPARNLAVALDLDAETTNAELRLEPGLTLFGRITDAQGKPISSAQAHLILQGDRIGTSLGQAARAGTDGRFEFSALPLDRRYSVNAFATGYGQENRRIDPSDSRNRRLELDPFQLILADQVVAGVVVDSNDKPVPNAWIYSYGEKQPNVNERTDRKGRFSFKVCPGTLQLSANNESGGYGNVRAEAGDTNITIRIGSVVGMRAEPPRPASLKGKPLPELATAGLSTSDCPAEQPVLAVLVDAEQRPSRRALRLVSEKAALLKGKNVAVLIIQAGSMTAEAFADWKKEASLGFPVGCFKDNPEKNRAAWGAAALPWLILTDKSHLVMEEGFPLDELESKLQKLGP